MPHPDALLAARAAALLLQPAGGAAAAEGDHTQSYTENVHGAFTEDFDANPCTGAAITSFKATGNVVNHVTYFPHSRAPTKRPHALSPRPADSAWLPSGESRRGGCLAGRVHVRKRRLKRHPPPSAPAADGSDVQSQNATPQ